MDFLWFLIELIPCSIAHRLLSQMLSDLSHHRWAFCRWCNGCKFFSLFFKQSLLGYFFFPTSVHISNRVQKSFELLFFLPVRIYVFSWDKTSKLLWGTIPLILYHISTFPEEIPWYRWVLCYIFVFQKLQKYT